MKKEKVSRMKLTDREWKGFYIGGNLGIFNVNSTSSGIDKNKLNTTKGKTPYVTRTDKSNGIDLFVSDVQNEKYAMDEGNVISIGLDTQTVFYQRHKFYTGQNIQVVSNSNLNEYTAQFICNLLKLQLQKFNWGGNGATLGRLVRTKIMLPVNDLDNPDYSFMEEYVREEEKYKKEKYIAYAKKQLKALQYIEIPTLKEKVWDEFSVGGDNGIFTISSGKRLTKADMDNGHIPFVGATDSNNGITNWVGKPNSTLDSNVLGVNYNGSVVENFYHPYLCVFSDDVKRLHLKNHEDNQYILLFFKSIILNQKSKYTYGYKFNAHRMERQKILLPLTDQGSPDYAYMEQYAKNLTFSKLKKYLSFVGQKTAQS
ncbi:MAG: restriction endonuclease subunit S [Anaerovoracaceae bacterium]